MEFSKIQFGKYLTVNQLNADIEELYETIMKENYEYTPEFSISNILKSFAPKKTDK